MLDPIVMWRLRSQRVTAEAIAIALNGSRRELRDRLQPIMGDDGAVTGEVALGLLRAIDPRSPLAARLLDKAIAPLVFDKPKEPTERSYAYVTFLKDGKLTPDTHLRHTGTLTATLCGKRLSGLQYSTGGVWHPDAPQPDCNVCALEAQTTPGPLRTVVFPDEDRTNDV